MVSLEGQLQTFCREWWPGFSLKFIAEIKYVGQCAVGCTASLQRCYRLKWLQSLQRWFVFSEVPCLAAMTNTWSLEIASEWIGQVIFFHYTGKEKWWIFVCKVIQASKFFFVRWLGSRNMTIIVAILGRSGKSSSMTPMSPRASIKRSRRTFPRNFAGVVPELFPEVENFSWL